MNSVNVCTCGEVETAYTVLIKHIVEEQVNQDIVAVATENEYYDLKYEIFDQYPADDGNKQLFIQN